MRRSALGACTKAVITPYTNVYLREKNGFGDELGQPAYTGGSGDGRVLSDDERDRLIANTAELLEQLKSEFAEQEAQAQARMLVAQQPLSRAPLQH